MAFNEQEKQLIIWGRANGKSKDEVTQALTRLRTGLGPASAPEEDEPSGIAGAVQDAPSDIADGFNSSVDAVSRGVQNADEARAQVESGEISPLAGTTKTIGGGLKAGAEVVGNALFTLGKLFVSPKTEKTVADTTTAVATSVAETEAAQMLLDKYNSLAPEQKATIDGFLGTSEGLATILGAGPATRALKTGAEAVATKGGELASEAVGLVKAGTDTAIKSTKEAAQKLPTLITPSKTADEAIRQIAQGKTTDVPSVKIALETIDTSGVETFKQLGQRLDETIPELSRQVDEELLKDTGIYKLKDLTAKGTTQGGQKVETDFITRALTNLSELYKTTGDSVSRGNIAEIMQKAKSTGLTRKDVNDISRQYGQEFGSKAFSKLGDPLTSVNAQAFENTRKGLKNIARQGLGGDEAKVLDAKLSALYDTKTLVSKNVEAVNKLQQRIQERGLLEKAGYLISKYADILTGGSIRGFVGGILPRGAGYKVMNALDVEEALRKNLDIVEKALKEKTDDAMHNVLRQSQPPQQ